MQLVADAISAGIFNDLGSGSNVDLCVITKGKVDYVRPAKQAGVKGSRYATFAATPKSFTNIHRQFSEKSCLKSKNWGCA